MNSGAITSAIVLSGLIRVRERARARRPNPHASPYIIQSAMFTGGS